MVINMPPFLFTEKFAATVIFLWLMVAEEASGGRIGFGHAAAFATVGGKMSSPQQVVSQPDYGVAGVDLSQKWIELVQDGKVVATVTIGPDDDEKCDIQVRYGVRASENSNSQFQCREFVEEVGSDSGASFRSDVVQTINETLSEMQRDSCDGVGEAVEDGTQCVRFKEVGGYIAQLQLVRTLRPPPSPGFVGSTTSNPPEYDAETDSFVTGPLRLELRPLVSTLNLQDLSTPWDVFHNVSPADTRGHFLLLPTISNKESNWRGQTLTKSDCRDLVMLAESIQPVGSLFLGFNSVGAGASQNHIHCHAWPSPSIPHLLSDGTEKETVDGWNSYAVSKVKNIHDILDIQDGVVEVSYLNYPVFCVQFSASGKNLSLLGDALSAALDVIGDAPYNVGFLNRPAYAYGDEDHDDEEEDNERVGNENEKFDGDEEGGGGPVVDVYLFVRSKERSDILPSLKLGVSEMMGVFHAQSVDEMEILGFLSEEEDEESDDDNDDDAEGDDDEHEEDIIVGNMAEALKEISAQDSLAVWTRLQSKLSELKSSS